MSESHAAPKTPAIQLIACNGDIVLVSLHQIAQAHARLRRSEVERIQEVCCRHFSVSRNELLSPRRDVRIVRARHVAMYLAKQLTDYSYPQIARRFGDRDHTTVMHACRKIEGLLEADWQTRANLEALELILSRQTGDAELSR